MPDNGWRRYRRISGLAPIFGAILYALLVAAMVGSGGLPRSAAAMLGKIDTHARPIRAVMAIFIVVDLGWLICRGGLFVTLMTQDRALPAIAWIVSAVGAVLDIISGLWSYRLRNLS